MNPHAKLLRFAKATLGLSLFVILWGALVRATGSGAGCGDHWPLCNGVVIPQDPTTATFIELTHRVTGGALLLAIFFLWWSNRRLFPQPYARVRKFALATVIFVIIEALIGAGIVLLRLVGDNDSEIRGAYIAVHLINTLVLIFMQCSHLFWLRQKIYGDQKTLQRDHSSGVRPWFRKAVIAGMGAVALTSAMGAITALGDTLFPSSSLLEGIRNDFDQGSHLFIRLRMWHPILAVLTSAALLWFCFELRSRTQIPIAVKKSANRVILLVLLQVVLGFVNLGLLAPLYMQLIHLGMANLLWMALVWLYWDLVLEASLINRIFGKGPIQL